MVRMKGVKEVIPGPLPPLLLYVVRMKLRDREANLARLNLSRSKLKYDRTRRKFECGAFDGNMGMWSTPMKEASIVRV